MFTKKCFSVFLSAVFLFSIIFPDFARAVPTPSDIVSGISLSDKPADTFFGNYAQITSVADYGGDTAVLNVQDFHMHSEVQKNISSIIDILVKKYGIENVFVEGAYGNVSTEWLVDMRKGYFGEETIEMLLNSATITGTEYYSAVNDKKDFLIGLENENIHKANMQRLGTLIEKQQYYENSLAALQKELDFFQEKYFGSQNKKLSKLVKRHKDGKVSSPKYYTLLLNYLNKNSEQSRGTYGTIMPMDMSDYPNICLLLHSYKIQDSMNVKKINKDMQTLVAGLKDSMSYMEYKKLLDQTDNMQDMHKLVAYLGTMPQDFKDKYFTSGISKYIDVTNRVRQINPVDLIAEERSLVHEIRIALSSNKNELEISFLSDFFSYFSDYMKTSISADDYIYLQGGFDKFQTIWAKYSFYNKTMNDLKGEFALLNEYYEVNDNRNEIFFDRITKNAVVRPGKMSKPALNGGLADVLKDKKNIIVCVTGGYHSKGLTELLNSKKVTFAVITPSVSGNIDGTMENYEAAAAEQAKIFSQSLALALYSQIVSHASSGNDLAAKRLAAKLFIFAAEKLENVPFENVDILIDNLNSAVGKDYSFAYDENTGEVSFKSNDGTYSEPFVEVRKNSEGKISIKQKYSLEEDKPEVNKYKKMFSGDEMKKFIENFGKVFQISTLDFGAGAFVPKMYASSVNIINWAAENNIFLDIDAINGVTFEMAERYGLENEILDTNPEVAKYYEQWQNALVRKYLKEEDFKNGGMPYTTKLLFAAGLLNEFIPVSSYTLNKNSNYHPATYYLDAVRGDNNIIRSMFYAVRESNREHRMSHPASRFLKVMKEQYDAINRDSSVIDRLWRQFEILKDGSRLSNEGMTVQEMMDLFSSRNALSDDEKILTEMKYGTAGYRAKFGAGLSYVHILVNAQAIAEVAKERFAAAKKEGKLKGREKAKIFVGYDTRFMSREFAEVIAAVLAVNGVEAVLSDVDTPTPAISWLLGSSNGEEYDLAVNITASHNPFEYNGIKVNEPFGGQAGSDITEAIQNKMSEISEGKIKIRYENLQKGFESGNAVMKSHLMEEYVAAYIEMFMRQFNIKNEADFHVFTEKAQQFYFVVDAKSGTTPLYYEQILDALGIQNYDIINDDFDPTFGGEDPNPDKNTEGIKNTMAYINNIYPGMPIYGLATDPDGDRMAVMENEKVFTADEIIIYNQYRLLEKAAQIAKETGKKQEVVIAPNLATTGALELVKEYFEREYPDLLDIKIVRTNIGFKWIAEVLKAAKDRNPNVITMGAEESGAVVVGGLTLDKDGIAATLGSVALAVDSGVTIAGTLEHIYSDKVLGWMPQKKMESVKFESMSDLSAKGAYLESVADDAAVQEAFIKQFEHLNDSFKIERVQKIVGTSFEGIQLFTSNPRVLIILRLSGTEPLVKVYAESDDEVLTDAIISTGKNALNNASTASDLVPSIVPLVVAEKTGSAVSTADKEVRAWFPSVFGGPVIKFVSEFVKDIFKFRKKSSKVLIVMSGGPASGGHNVVAGVYDTLINANPDSKLYGAVGGPGGLVGGAFTELTEEQIDEVRNTGGFFLPTTGRQRITPETLEAMKNNILKEGFDSVVIVGGDGSNMLALTLAEMLSKQNTGRQINVVGVPKTMDGDIKNEYVETTFGFDTASKVYSYAIGNIAMDAKSTGRHWHFIRLMGRNASHITLECALQTQPNIALIGEEILQKQMTLDQVVGEIADSVIQRAKAGKDYGVVLIPEGLFEFIPEIRAFIDRANEIYASFENENRVFQNKRELKAAMFGKLSDAEKDFVSGLPANLADIILSERDVTGKISLSKIEAEKIIIEMLEDRLSKNDEYKNIKKNGAFSSKSHFFGYEGRAARPSNFDAAYSYNLGETAAALILNNYSGYMAYVRNLSDGIENWEQGGVPITSLVNADKGRPYIEQYLVDTESDFFKAFAKKRESWKYPDDYIAPSPIQYSGDVSNVTNATLIWRILDESNRETKIAAEAAVPEAVIVNKKQTEQKTTIEDINIQPGQKIIMRVDYNVPMKDGKITDDTRIRATLETIKYITDRGGKVVLMSHLGRPDGKVVPEMSLAPVAQYLGELLGKDIKFLNDAIGEKNASEINALSNGDVVLLENVRFYAQEEENNEAFAKKLAANVGSDAIFVMDAFGTAHRAHASTEGVSKFVSQKVAGLLMSKELQFLGRELENPTTPSVAIIGGSKVTDKIGVISSLLEKVDTVIIGGAMAYAFLAAQGIETGTSLIGDFGKPETREENIKLAKELIGKAEAMGKTLLLPVDHKIVKSDTVDFKEGSLKEGNDLKNTAAESIESNYMGVDIGPKTVKLYADKIIGAKTILWNGPMGIFEVDELAGGTYAIADALVKATEENGAITIVGGGDSVAAVNKAGVADKMSHVSTGGGASLEFLEKGTLPAVESLDNIANLRTHQTKEWGELQLQQQKMAGSSIENVFKNDPDRSTTEKIKKNYIQTLKGENAEMAVDISFSNTDEDTMRRLMDLAKARDIKGFIERMMSGEKVNETEDRGRAVLHTALRNVEKDADGNIVSKGPIYVDGKDVMPEIVRVLEQMRDFDKKLESGELRGVTDKPIKTIISIGIGGSDLGPKMATAALERYRRKGIDVRYISNVDPRAAQMVMRDLDPETTMVIVESKTFTTQETIENAKSVRNAFIRMLSAVDRTKSAEDIVSKHFVAVSTARKEVSNFGIDVLSKESVEILNKKIANEIDNRLASLSNTKTAEELAREVRKELTEGITDNIFEFWDFVGGRYSIWSAIGLPLVAAVGFDNYFEMLQGANEMDTHFAEADYENNIPIRLAMIWIWYINFFKYDVHAIIPYSEDLRLFPKYIQQLYMESLGKSTDMDGNRIMDYATGAYVFGESGTDSQHSFFQLFHQGTGIIPIDFITYMEPPALRDDMTAEEIAGIQLRHAIFLSNVFAQREAFAMGRNQEEIDAEVESAMNKVLEDMKAKGASEEDMAFERERYEKLKLHKSFDGNRPSNLITFDKLNPESFGMLIALYEHITTVQGAIWNVNAFDQWGVELGKVLAKSLQKTMLENAPMPLGFSTTTNYWISKKYAESIPKTLSHWLASKITNFMWIFKSFTFASSKKIGKLTETKQWKKLRDNFEKMKNISIKDLFNEDPGRRSVRALTKNYIQKLEGKNAEMILDTSFSNTDKKTISLLLDLARKRDVKGFIKRMMSGKKINETENRAVLHTALRNVEKDKDGNIVSKGPIYVDGKDVMPDIVRVLEQMREFDRKLINKELKGVTGKPIKTIISIGIGGSDLGPRMATAALDKYKRSSIDVRYVSNVDPRAAQLAMKDLDPETTMVIVESKTFTTQETIENAKAVRSEMIKKLQTVDPSKSAEDIVSKHFIAVSTARKEVKDFGINVFSDEELADHENKINELAAAWHTTNHLSKKSDEEIKRESRKALSYGITDNIFEFWDFVGGRYSIWSAIGLPLVAAVGFDNYFEMLQGANEMDTHFAEADYEDNIPIRLAMIWIWYINFFKYDAHAIIPYSEDLRLFPKYIQQLYMESLGKSTDMDGNRIMDYATGAYVFGESGTDSQHSFFQLFHQGTGIIPIDFITYMEPPALRDNMSPEAIADVQLRHAIFLSNVFAQREAFAMGRFQEEIDAEVENAMNKVLEDMKAKGASEEDMAFERERYEKLKLHKSFDGNRPTNFITFDKLNPESFGMLIALYEHITTVQGAIWNVNAFDQWGVELGKALAKGLQPTMADREKAREEGKEIGDEFSATTQYHVESYEESKGRGQAIMEENYPRVIASLINGKSAFVTVLQMFQTEYRIAKNNPVEFILGHRTEDMNAAADFTTEVRKDMPRPKLFTRAVTVLASGIAAVFIVPSFSVLSLAAVAGFAIVAGLALAEIVFKFSAVKKYFSIDYKFVKDLKREIDMYGSKMSEKEMSEADYLGAFIINSMPENPQEMGFKNTGLKTSSGQIIWTSTKTGRLVIFAKNSDFSNIVTSVTDVMPAILNKVGSDFEISAIAVDESDNLPKNINYFGDLLVVKKTYYDELLQLTGYDAKVAGEKIRNEKEAGKNAAARNFVMDLSRIESSDNVKEVIRALSGYNRTDNPQIAVPYSFIEKLAARQLEIESAGKQLGAYESINRTTEIIKGLLADWKQSGLRVFATMDESVEDRFNMQAKFIEYGFSGYIERKDGKIFRFRDYTADFNAPVAEISGFVNRDGLIKQIEEARSDAVKVVDVMDFTALISKDDSDIASRVLELSNMFGRNIISIFKKTINEQYVTDAVLELNMNAIPDINEEMMGAIHDAVAEAERLMDVVENAKRNGSSAAAVRTAEINAVKAMRKALWELRKMPVNKSVELNMLNTEITENVQEADIEKVQYAFLKIIAQKAKVKSDLYSNSALGLQDKELEILLVKSALSQHIVDRNAILRLEKDLASPFMQRGEAVSWQELSSAEQLEDRRMAAEGGLPVMSAREAFDTVSVRAKALMLRDTAAAATVYEMLLLYAERKTDTSVQERSLSVDTKALTALLAAA